MRYITGDIHADPDRIRQIAAFCEENKTTRDDYLFVLGDVGVNYYCDYRDYPVKQQMADIPVTFICIRGNHEARPCNVPSYREVSAFGGKVYVEEAFPNIIFLKDGAEYEIGSRILAIGGAYSVDKDYRLMNGLRWFEDEQLTAQECSEILDRVKGRSYDLVLTHTCPFEWQPTERFLPSVDQSKTDKSMELFLGLLERAITYRKWYFAHYHGNKSMGKYEMLFEKIKPLD